MNEGVSTERAAELNRALWDSIRRQRDERLIPKQHDVPGDLLAGKSALYPEHRELVGDVRGKRLLDLGCGAGMELLDWARQGASVTGVDNSPRQIAAARQAAERLGLECTLMVADLLRLPEELLRGEFDVVFSSWVTAWIGDLGRWFGNAARALKSGGVFVLTGGHPLASYFGEVDHGEDYRKSYFEQGPFVFDDMEVNAEWNAAGDRHTAVEWRPMLGSIVTAVAQSGLRVTHLIEAPDIHGKTGLPEGYPGRFTVRAVKES